MTNEMNAGDVNHGFRADYSAQARLTLEPIHALPRSRSFRSSLAVLGLACTLCSGASAGQNWPQWRGPLQNGVAPDANPPTEWSESKNVKWKVKIPGEGSSTPIIWEDKVFVLTAIPTGKKINPPASAVAESAPPPAGAAPDGPGQRGPFRGGPGGGRGGFGGFGGFNPGGMLGQRMLSSGDANNDGKLSRDELVSLAEAWFDKLDSEKAGKLDQEKFVERFGAVMGAPGDSGPPGGRGGGGARIVAPGLFGATDISKDGNLTRDEFRDTFVRWFSEWDTDKAGSLNEEKLRAGLDAALPRPQFGGPGGFGGAGRGPGGPGGRGGGPGGRGGFGGMGGQKPTEVHQFAVLCLDRGTGKVLWQQVAREEVPHEGHHPSDGSYSAPSPITDGQHVFASFGSRGLYCYDMNGKLEWSEDLGDMQVALSFGEGSSPVLSGDSVIVNWDHEGESFIVALDKRTGKRLWKTTREERTSWSTPLIVEHQGKKQVITSASGKIRTYDVSSGNLVWECAGMTANVIPSPVADAGTVYCISGFRGNALLAIRLGGAGDLTASDSVLWRHNRSTPYVPSPMLSGDRLYFLASNNGRISCVDTKSGKVLIDAEPVEGVPNIYASPVGANGKIYLVGRNGTAVVLKQSDKVEVLATNRLDDRFDASPAVAGQELYLRGREHLYCLAQN